VERNRRNSPVSISVRATFIRGMTDRLINICQNSLGQHLLENSRSCFSATLSIPALFTDLERSTLAPTLDCWSTTVEPECELASGSSFLALSISRRLSLSSCSLQSTTRLLQPQSLSSYHLQPLSRSSKSQSLFVLPMQLRWTFS
jgi:hypothetical protein